MRSPDNNTNEPSVYIERVSPKHIEHIAIIERDTFSEPWSENSLALLCTDEYPSLALCDESGAVLGYVGTITTMDELQIINVAVRKDLRRKGYGKLLLTALDEYCQQNGISSISLEVRCSNIAAISLYRECGYNAVGTRKSFYRFPTEDASVMVKQFSDK